MKPRLAAVVPAAGLSRRMGSEKALLPFGSSTVLETVLGKLAKAGVEETVVVVRRDLPAAADRARSLGARVVVNDHPEAEMLTSIRLGIADFSSGILAFFLWPADHPAVSVSTLETLAASADRERAVIPCYRGRRGHPALVGAGLRAAIDAIPNGEGLRQLWRTLPQAVREIEVADPGVLLNVDTPKAYEEALRLTERADSGSHRPGAAGISKP